MGSGEASLLGELRRNAQEVGSNGDENGHTHTLVDKMRQYIKDNRNQGSWDKNVASCYNLTDIAVDIIYVLV